MEFVQKDDFYSITILNPKVADMGKYTLVVKIEKDTYHIGAYLDVKGNIHCLDSVSLPHEQFVTTKLSVFYWDFMNVKLH